MTKFVIKWDFIVPNSNALRAKTIVTNIQMILFLAMSMSDQSVCKLKMVGITQ